MRIQPIKDKTLVLVLLVIYTGIILFLLLANLMLNTCSKLHTHVLEEVYCVCLGYHYVQVLSIPIFVFFSLLLPFIFLGAAFCPFRFQLHLLNFLRFIAGFTILHQLFYFTMHDLSAGQYDLQIRSSLAVINLC